MKVFEDLEFNIHPFYTNGFQARMVFPNNWGVSVLLGDVFYSNGVDTYELAITNADGDVDYSSGITDDVEGDLTADEVSQIMLQVQNLGKW